MVLIAACSVVLATPAAVCAAGTKGGITLSGPAVVAPGTVVAVRVACDNPDDELIGGITGTISTSGLSFKGCGTGFSTADLVVMMPDMGLREVVYVYEVTAEAGRTVSVECTDVDVQMADTSLSFSGHGATWTADVVAKEEDGVTVQIEAPKDVGTSANDDDYMRISLYGDFAETEIQGKARATGMHLLDSSDNSWTFETGIGNESCHLDFIVTAEPGETVALELYDMTAVQNGTELAVWPSEVTWECEVRSYPQPAADSGYSFVYRGNPLSADLPADTVWLMNYEGTLPEKLEIPNEVDLVGALDKWSSAVEMAPGFGDADGAREAAAIREVDLPQGVSIGYYAFSGCAGLEVINLEDAAGVKGAAFKDCSALQSIALPPCDEVGEQSVAEFQIFSGCTRLTDVTIPSGYTTLGEGLFEDCTALAELVLPASIDTIILDAFSGCMNLKTITYGGTMAEWWAIGSDTGLAEDTVIVCSDGTLDTPYPPSEPALRPDTDWLITTDPQVEGPVLTGITAGAAGKTVTVEEVLASFELPQGMTAVMNSSDGSLCADNAPAGTGDQIIFRTSGGNEERITVIVRGDVIGSGMMNISQLVRMAAAVTGTKPLQGAYLAAADMNGSGSLDISDLVAEARLLTDSSAD